MDTEYDEVLRDYFINSLIAYFKNDTIWLINPYYFLEMIIVVDSYQENIEKKLGKLQNQLLTPIRNYMEQLLNVKIPIHSDFETTELTPETLDILYNYIKTLVYLINFHFIKFFLMVYFC